MARKKEAAGGPGWWGERWLTFTAGSLHVGPSSDSQLHSARRAETKISVARGQVCAVVAVGSYGATATAVIKVKPLTAAGWRKALDGVAADPETAQRLLSGNPGPDLEAAFTRAGQALFPEHTGAGRAARCTCQERWGCRHLNALVVHGAAFFDANPLFWLEVLGGSRDAVFAALRARLADNGLAVPGEAESALAADATAAEQPLSEERFWDTELDPDSIAVRPGIAAAADAQLRLLGPIPLPEEAGRVDLWTEQGPLQQKLDQVLRRYVSRIGESASALSTGDRAPAYVGDQVEGKAIHTGVRLVPEVAEAVRQEGKVLDLEQLRALCPTAAAAPDHLYRAFLTSAFVDLPPDLLVLGQHLVAPRSAVLDGASFSHVITFDEWRRGRLSQDSDWAKALAIAGHAPPYQVRVDSPELGDELRLTVTDPDRPALAARLIRRRERSLEDRDRASQAAARTLEQHLTQTGRNSLSQEDALALLLGWRRFHGRGTDPVWLLPLWSRALSHSGTDRGMTTQPSYWQPTFGRPSYGHWNDQTTLRQFQAVLMRRGERRQQIERATACVEWWCQYYRDPQDTAAKAVPLGALLHFLWILAPLEAARYRAAVEGVPEFMGLWFTVLSETSPALQKAYGDHIAACGLTEPYAERLRTRPGRSGGVEQLAWEVEGYRWIGPERYFFVSAESPWWR